MKSHPKHGRAARQDRTARHDLPLHRPTAAAHPAAGRHGRSAHPAAAAHPCRPCRMSRRTLALADLKLAQIEDAFLDTLLDAHPRRTTALDRLLDDLAGAAPADGPSVAAAALPVADAGAAAASARRIESALLGAVIHRHPRRDRALDRLLCDLALPGNESVAAPDAAHGAWVDEEEARRAAFDVCCDNDFDGLG